jgi:hypothetical protein
MIECTVFWLEFIETPAVLEDDDRMVLNIASLWCCQQCAAEFVTQWVTHQLLSKQRVVLQLPCLQLLQRQADSEAAARHHDRPLQATTKQHVAQALLLCWLLRTRAGRARHTSDLIRSSVLLLCTGGSISTSSSCCCCCWSTATGRWCWQGQGVCGIGLLLLFLLGVLLLILLLLRLRADRSVCCGRVL